MLIDLSTGPETGFEALETDQSLRGYVSKKVERSYCDEFDAHTDTVADVARDLQARYERGDTGHRFFESFGTLWFE